MLTTLIEKGQFFHYFQPIYDIQTFTRMGYEGLFRTSLFSSIEETFNLAKIEKQLYELDSRSIHKAALTYKSAGFTKREGYLFLNVFPSTLLNTSFLPFLKEIMYENDYASQQLVFEISEMERITDFQRLKSIIFKLKSEGILFAIDDMGKGNTEFKSIIELEPDFIKLDGYFSTNLDEEIKKQEIIKLLLHYCHDQNIKLILEGLETEKQLAVAKSLGVKFAQGYVLGKPGEL